MHVQFLKTLRGDLQSRDIYLWDVGKVALWTFYYMASRGIDIRGFVTNYPEYCGETIMNRPVISPEDFRTKEGAVLITGDDVSEGTFALVSSFGECYRWSDALEYNPLLKGDSLYVCGADYALRDIVHASRDAGFQIVGFVDIDSERGERGCRDPERGEYERGEHESILGVPVYALDEAAVPQDARILLFERNQREDQAMLDMLEKTVFPGTVFVRELVRPEDIWSFDPYIMLDDALKKGKRILFCCEDPSASELFHRVFRIYGVPVAREISFEGVRGDGSDDIWSLADEDPDSSVLLIHSYEPMRRYEIVEAANDLGFSAGAKNYAATNVACYNRRRFAHEFIYSYDVKLGVSIDYSASGGRPGWAVYGDESKAATRIMVLGGSTSSEVYYPQSWVGKLYEMLQERGIPVVIFNGAHEANHVFHEINRMIRDIRVLHPDIVVSMSGVNDLGGIPNVFERDHDENVFAYWRRMESYMKLIAEAEGATFHAILQPIQQTPGEMSLYESMMHLREVHRRARVFTENRRDDDFYTNLMTRFLHHEEFMIDMCHYSDEGNSVLAQEVFDIIRGDLGL